MARRLVVHGGVERGGRIGARGRRLLGNFAVLSGAEVLCRALSVVVTLGLARRLGQAGYGRIEFAFQFVIWLAPLVRDGLDVMAAREISRHRRLLRSIVAQVLMMRVVVAGVLYLGILILGVFGSRVVGGGGLLGVYGLLLLTTSLGVDYAFRGMERMGVVAISLVIRTIVYVVGVTISEIGPGRLEVVPIWLVFGEAVGILFSWTMLVRGYGWPRMRWGRWRFSRVFAARCRSIYLMQGSQSILASLDMIIVGFTSTWVEVGRYGAAHRMVSIGLAVGMMVPQVVFPSLARSWRMGSGEARGILDGVVRLVVMASVPLVVGVLVFGGPVVGLIFGGEFRGTGRYLSMGIARAPIFVMAYLYMTTLVALNRESRGVWIQVAAAISAVVLVCMGRWLMGPEGAILGMLATGVGVWVAGYWSLRELGRAPGWHHHVWRPIVAGFLMWVVGVRSEGMGLALGMLLSVVCYVVVLVGLGGIGLGELLAIWPWAGRGCGRVKVGGLGGGDSERDSVLNYEDARI